uniref:Immunoglobulin I-set domain-containing protein n=1 Tax=Ficedula albicollis TaxID=59894 RepID=A0A803V5R7_FICAL
PLYQSAIEIDEHYAFSLEQGKYASLTIKGVTSEDSGKYSIHVKNKHGGETVDVTVSVYRHDSELQLDRYSEMFLLALKPLVLQV